MRRRIILAATEGFPVVLPQRVRRLIRRRFPRKERFQEALHQALHRENIFFSIGRNYGVVRCRAENAIV